MQLIMVRKRTRSELTKAFAYDRQRFLRKAHAERYPKISQLQFVEELAFQLDLETCLEITE
jgi:hypothetical protein